MLAYVEAGSSRLEYYPGPPYPFAPPPPVLKDFLILSTLFRLTSGEVAIDDGRVGAKPALSRAARLKPSYS